MTFLILLSNYSCKYYYVFKRTLALLDKTKLLDFSLLNLWLWVFFSSLNFFWHFLKSLRCSTIIKWNRKREWETNFWKVLRVFLQIHLLIFNQILRIMNHKLESFWNQETFLEKNKKNARALVMIPLALFILILFYSM